MRLNEFIICQVYRTKLGELVVKLKLKEMDAPLELEQKLREFWREGVPCKSYKVEEYQKDESNPENNG